TEKGRWVRTIARLAEVIELQGVVAAAPTIRRCRNLPGGKGLGWWVRAGGLNANAGAARKRAACRPTHPSRWLVAVSANGRSLLQSRALVGSPRPGSFAGITCISLTRRHHRGLVPQGTPQQLRHAGRCFAMHGILKARAVPRESGRA